MRQREQSKGRTPKRPIRTRADIRKVFDLGASFSMTEEEVMEVARSNYLVPIRFLPMPKFRALLELVTTTGEIKLIRARAKSEEERLATERAEQQAREKEQRAREKVRAIRADWKKKRKEGKLSRRAKIKRARGEI